MIDNDILNRIKQVPIPRILADLGVCPVHHKDPYGGSGKYLYLATYREERHPSLSVFCHGDQWLYKDHTTGEYGTNIDLLVRFGFFASWREAAEYVAGKYLYLSSVTVTNPKPGTSSLLPSAGKNAEASTSGVILGARSVAGSPAEEYITSVRRIPMSVASMYLSYVTYSYPPSPKTLYGVGWPTLAGGWAIRWPRDLGPGKGKYFVGPAGITYAPAMTSGKAGTCAVFEGIFDFLSFIVVNGCLNVDAVVLNSVGNVMSAVEFLLKYEEVWCYLDDDEGGHRATNTVMNCLGTKAKDCSYVFHPYNDFNEYLKL